MTDTPTGATVPRTSRPKTWPSASSGRKMTLVTASISICARRPLPRPSAITARHADVNPNAE